MATRDIVKDALSLCPAHRAALIGRLIESLDVTNDADAATEWDREIARRLEELDSGKVKPVAWSKVKRELRSGTRASAR